MSQRVPQWPCSWRHLVVICLLLLLDNAGKLADGILPVQRLEGQPWCAPQDAAQAGSCHQHHCRLLQLVAQQLQQLRRSSNGMSYEKQQAPAISYVSYTVLPSKVQGDVTGLHMS